MPQTVLRRYTPPTCTLEVMATGSALSRWTDRAVLKNLRFRLHLDDPKIAEDQQVMLQGDRNHLEALCATVDGYVQNWLSRSPSDPLPAGRKADSGATALQVLEPTTLQANHNEMNGTEAAMSLEPQGLLNHRLHLGMLANEQSGESIALSTLQLFDLANALDQYQSDAVSLPSLARPGWMRSPAGWASIAAMALLTVGVTGAIAKFVMDVSNPPIQTASTSVETETNLSQGTPPTPLAIPSPPSSPSPSLSLTPLPPPAPPSGAIQSAPPVPPPVSISRQPVPVAPVPAPPIVEVPQATTPPPPERIAIAPPQGGSGQPSITEIPEIQSSASGAPEAGIAAADAPENGQASDTARTAANSGTAFDTLPQVAEIRQYFEQNWQPPTELSQTLEYRLVLNADGSLQRIVPLGQAAETFLDRTSMPLLNEPFVSPTDNGGNPQIRLVLRPDGKVQTFLEYAR